MRESLNAAIFLDFENLYYTLKNQVPDGYEVIDELTQMLRRLRGDVAEKLGARPLILRAYADFERMPEDMQRRLFLSGFDPQFVPGTDHKNAADMRLCIDAIAALYNRNDIDVYVLAAGDRDYIPMLTHLIERGKRIYVFSFAESLSGDLRIIVGPDAVMDADQYLSEAAHVAITDEKRRRTNDVKAVQLRAIEAKSETLKPHPAMAPPVDDESRTFAETTSLTDVHAQDALAFILRDYGHHREIYLKPLLYAFEREFAWMADWERKDLLAALQDAGAIVVEKRFADEKTFSVVRLNYNHPDVRGLHA